MSTNQDFYIKRIPNTDERKRNCYYTEKELRMIMNTLINDPEVEEDSAILNKVKTVLEQYN